MPQFANQYNPTLPTPTRLLPQLSSIYTVQLEVRRDNLPYITMDTPIPENFGFHLSSTYDRPFAKPLSETIGNKVGMGEEAGMAEQIARATTGLTSINKYLSGSVWSSGSSLILTIPFAIVAYDNAKEEVTDKIKKLMQLTTPTTAAGFLVAPGPHIGNLDAIRSGDVSAVAQLGGDEITLRIGRFFKFTPCVINDVNATFDTQFDARGNPIAATVNVTFEAFWTTTSEDLDAAFIGL